MLYAWAQWLHIYAGLALSSQRKNINKITLCNQLEIKKIQIG